MNKFYQPNNWFTRKWTHFWIKRGSLSPGGRLAMALAAVFTVPHKNRVVLANIAKTGYISFKAIINHDELSMGDHVFIDDGCIIYKRAEKGGITLADRAILYREVFMESGWGGSITVDEKASIHPRCQLNAFVESIHIGKSVMLAPFCIIYSYDHGLVPDSLIVSQPLVSKGPVIIGDGAWLGAGVIVTSGVTIGEGAAIGAGSVVTKNIPPNAIAVGNPAKVVRMR